MQAPSNNRQDDMHNRKHIVVLIWALVRLPALAVVVYLLRNPILNGIEQQFDTFRVIGFAIAILSTPATRVIVCGLMFTLLLLLVLLVRRRPDAVAYAFLLTVAGAVLAVLVTLGSISLRRALLVELILAVNMTPSQVIGPLKQFSRLWNTVMLAAVGFVELFLWREYWHWVRQWVRGLPIDAVGKRRIASVIPGLLLTSVVFALLVGAEHLLRFEQRIRMSIGVRVVESGLSFNGLALDPTGTYLFVTGHDLPRLRRYDVRNLSAPPVTSDLETGGAQGLTYDRQTNEIFLFNTVTRQLLRIDATTMSGERVVDLPDLSPGDMWLAVDRTTHTLTVASEADLQIGVPFMVLDRSTGRVLAQADLDGSNLLLHPAKPLLYLTFFRRRDQVILYDLQKRSVTHSGYTGRRANRMAFSRRRNELLVTSPMESRVIRFDADQLSLKGSIRTLFGGRAIAIDETRNLLLCGSLTTGHLVVIDHETGTHLRTYYLGPWLRSIELHIQSGTAYVSSRGALYRVDYAADHPAADKPRGRTAGRAARHSS
jgi:hypothetical protein